MTDTTTRIGVALTIGHTAETCVHAHTTPAGATAITTRLTELAAHADGLPSDQTREVIAVIGRTPNALVLRRRIPADTVEDLVTAVLEDR